MFLQYKYPLLLILSPLINAQAVPQDPVFDCTNTNYRVIYTACRARDYSHCCAVGTDCCAGGCCDLTSVCVGIGTSRETCCDFSDPTHCGTGPSNPVPSVICTGAGGLSSYKCPHGSTCNSHNDSCYLPAGAASSASSPLSTSQPAAASSVIASAQTSSVNQGAGGGTTV